VQKRNGERKKCEERKEKRWEDINTSKVVYVRSLNLDLDLLWKILGVKLVENIKDIYLMCLPKFQGVWSCLEQGVNHFMFRSQFEVISTK
jgi:hypothetical protein